MCRYDNRVYGHKDLQHPPASPSEIRRTVVSKTNLMGIPHVVGRILVSNCIWTGDGGETILLSITGFLNPFSSVHVRPDHVNQVLRGPPAQDDPALLRWVRSQLVPPSRLPYNLTYLISGLHQELDRPGAPYSPSQEFILGKIEELYGAAVRPDCHPLKPSTNFNNIRSYKV